MTSHPPEITPPVSSAMRSAILQQLVDIALSTVNKQLDAFITRLSDALLGGAAETHTNAEEAKRYFDAANLLKRNRYPFYYAVSERLAATLQQAVTVAGDASLAANTDALPETSAPDVEVDRTLCLIKASRAIESDHADRLAALNLRLGRLLGDDALDTAKNPFRPQLFLSAIDEAWCAFHPDSAAHHLVFRLLGPELCVDLGPILHAQNAVLIRRGILPTLGEPSPLGPTAQVTEQGGDPLTLQLRRLFPAVPNNNIISGDRPLAGALPTLLDGDQLRTRAAREQLFGYLTQLQRNGINPDQADNVQAMSLLTHIRYSAPAGALLPTDAHTLDLLIPIFNAILGNPAMPAEIQTLLGSLQIPVLKAVLADRDFFFRPAHPTRRVVELLARLGIGWDRKTGPNDPLYQTILRNVKRIQSDQRAPSFADALADIESFIADQDAASEAALASTISRALQTEKQLHAAKTAKHDIALRIGTGEVTAFVETFLEDKWVSVLTLAYAVKEEKPRAAESAVKTMDDLCWSVKPKITMEERKELLGKLPSIVAMLNKWLDLIRWNDAARVKFFDDLANCHASIVRAPLALSPERQVQLALAVAKKAAERRLRREARQRPEPIPDTFMQMVDRLECGTWMTFSMKDRTTARLRLAWISPMRNMFVFATAEQQEALSMPVEELAQALRVGRARVALSAGLVSQALEQTLAANSNARTQSAA